MAAILGIIVLLGSAYGWAYLEAPIVSYALSGPSTYLLGYGIDGVLVPLQVAVTAENTGPTDVDINVTISAVNATLSLSVSGSFVRVLSQAYLIVQAKSSWGGYPAIYVKPDAGVSGFRVSIVTVQPTPPIETNPTPLSPVSWVLAKLTRLSPVMPTTLQYLKDPSVTNRFDLTR